VREPYPIPGIVRSYQRTRELPTVAMPLLIGAVIVGLGVFFLKTGDLPGGGSGVASESSPLPSEGAESRSLLDVAAHRGASPLGVESERPEAGASEGGTSAPFAASAGKAEEDAPSGNGSQDVIVSAAAGGVESVSLDRSADSGAAAASLPLESFESRFTSWMSPTALDTYIRARNAGYTESFWRRGHWIPSVEGRWHRGATEFRIVIEEMPSPEAWHWHYRINLTEAEFSRTAYDMQEQGFRLQFHQVFLDGAATRRVQAVWRRPTPSADVVER